MSDDSPAGSQRTTIECPPDNAEHNDEDHPPTPDVHSGTPDLIMDQLTKDQPTQQDALSTTGLVSIQPANDMVDPLQVLLASAPPVMGSPTITEEEDQLLGAEEVTTEEVAARLPPQPTQGPSDDAPHDDKDDFKLTATDVGDNMEDI